MSSVLEVSDIIGYVQARMRSIHGTVGTIQRFVDVEDTRVVHQNYVANKGGPRPLIGQQNHVLGMTGIKPRTIARWHCQCFCNLYKRINHGYRLLRVGLPTKCKLTIRNLADVALHYDLVQFC